MSVSRRELLAIAGALGIGGAIANVAPAAAQSNGVVGAWSLVSFEVDEPKGAHKDRFGANPVGYLMYTADGHMAAVLGGVGRPKLEPPPVKASDEQCTDSVANFLAYAGRYEIKGDRVYHHVDVSVFTNLIGTTLIRQFTLSGDTLTIRTLPPEIWGGSNVLIWKRA